jgi:acetyl-CoA carboxylase beta subunit
VSWVSFICGGMTVLIAYALFSSDREEEVETVPAAGETDLIVNDFSGRYVTLSCQTCRKLKRHKEIQPNLFQCTKCKRHVDIRVS